MHMHPMTDQAILITTSTMAITILISTTTMMVMTRLTRQVRAITIRCSIKRPTG